MIFGRQALIDQVARVEAPLLLLSGDSGIGKSAVLIAASSAHEGWINIPPVTLRRSSGSLYTGYLDGLVQVLAELAGRDDGPSLRERLMTAVSALANERLDTLGRMVLSELVALIRGRVGEDVGRASDEYLRGIWPDSIETTVNNIAQARGAALCEILARFTEAILGFAEGGERLGLSFDEGQRLSEEDRRLLADLAEALPERCHLRVAYTTDNSARGRELRELIASTSAAVEIEVAALRVDAVAEWLATNELDETHADELLAWSDGYALLVDAGIAALRRGDTLADVPLEHRLAESTRVSWHTLSSEASATARGLAVLTDPLSRADMRELVGVADSLVWTSLVAELRGARIFSGEVNGEPWFHPQRRRFVLHECMSPTDLDEAASAAAALIWRTLRPTDFAAVTQYAELVALSPSVQATDPQMEAALALEGEALAVAAAYVELVTRQSPILDAGPLVAHAIRFIGRMNDPAGTIDALKSSNLFFVYSNQEAMVVGASWSAEVTAVIQGRAAKLLLRPPIPLLVELAFQLTLSDQLSGFTAIRFGIGAVSFGGLAKVLAEPPREPGKIVVTSRRNSQPALLVRGLVADDLPLYCIITFEDEAGREATRAALDGLVVESIIGTTRIEALLDQPSEPVPSERFADTFQRLVSGHRRINLQRQIVYPAPSGVSAEDLAAARVATAVLIRARSDSLEQAAYDLDSGYTLAWDAEPDFHDEIVMRGSKSDRQIRLTLERTGLAAQPFEQVHVVQAIEPTPGEAYAWRSTHWGPGTNHPVASEISYRRTRATEYNRSQPYLYVRLDASELSARIEQAFLQSIGDARAMREEIPLMRDVPEIPPRGLWTLLAVSDRGEAEFRQRGGFDSGIYAEGPSGSGRDEVHAQFVIVQHSDPYPRFEDVFPDASKEWQIRTSFPEAVAALLHHGRDELRFRWPDGEFYLPSL